MNHTVDPTLRPFHVDVYEALRQAWLEYGSGPSQYELMLACRCSSTTVINGLRELKKRGLITAPKFGQRTAKPTDLDRTVSREPISPWAELDETPQKFWRKKEAT